MDDELMTVSTIDFCTTLDKAALHKIKSDTDLLYSLRGKVIYVGETTGGPSVLSENSILLTDFPQVIFYRLGELGIDKDIKSFTGREQIQNKLFLIFEKSSKCSFALSC